MNLDDVNSVHLLKLFSGPINIQIRIMKFVETIRVEYIDSLPYQNDSCLMTMQVSDNDKIDKFPDILQTNRNCGFDLDDTETDDLHFQFIVVHCLDFEIYQQLYFHWNVNLDLFLDVTIMKDDEGNHSAHLIIEPPGSM